MADGSSESPLDLKAVLDVLESDASSDEQVLESYSQLCCHMSKEMSLFERDFVEQGRRLVAVTKKHVTSNGELKNSITPKALNVMGCCVNNKDIVSLLTAEEMGELVSIWNKIVAETKEKNTCTYAFWCLSNQAFPAHIMSTELPSLMNTFSRAAVSWWNTSTMVEHAAMIAIQKLGMQCPKDMKAMCPKWGPPYLRLLVSQSPQIREHVLGKIQKWAVFLASCKEFLRTGISTVSNKIVPTLNTMFTNGMEVFALKTCTLLIQIFRQEVQNIMLLNSLLSVQEQAFRCFSPQVRCQAFQSWGILIDILNDKGIMQKAKFVELVMRVFKTRNTNTEQVAVAKLNTWWHYVLLMGPAIWPQFDQIMRPLLQFCLGNIKLGVDSGSSLLRAIHDPCGDPAQVPVACSSPGSAVDLPTFPKTQQGGLVILAYLLQDADHLATFSFDLEPLKKTNSMPLNVCIKNARFLISAIVEFSKVFGTTNEVQLLFVWDRMTSFILAAVENDRDESNTAVSSFLSQFQTLIASNVLPSKMTMKLFQLVCSLPSDVLSSPSLVDGSLFKCRAHSLCELLLSSSALSECGDQERFVTLFMSLVRCGTKHPGGSLPFLESVGKLLDERASAMPSAQALWRLWSFVANTVHDCISATNQVDQDDDLWPNFGCLYTVLLLPVSHLLGPRLPQTVHKTAFKTLTELYHTFARLAAMVTTAEANVVVEDFSQKIISKIAEESFEKDLQTLDHLVELCQTLVDTVDFSSLTTANPFMKGIRSSAAKHRASPKPLGNLHSLLSLLTRLTRLVLDQIHSEGGGSKPAAGKQKKSDGILQLGSCCSKLMDIFIMLVTSVTMSSLVSHMIEMLTPSLAALFTAIPKKLPAKVCTSAFTQKLDRLWQEVCSMLRTHYKGQYDSDLLHQMAPLLHAAFLHPRRLIKNHTVQLWNATFGAGSAPLAYPTQLQIPVSIRGVLVKMRAKTQLSLPGWIATDITFIDETPVSQMSQMDSQAPEALLPGMPSPVRLCGSFLNKDTSPKSTPKSTSPKPVQPASENKRSAFNARKKLSLDSMPQKDFVVITGTPNRRRILTEHQKEVLKEKRALPAMYNNLDASQDISLMAHFSSDTTQQQDSLLNKPTIDDVIVVNSSQSQGTLEQNQVNIDQPPEEKLEATKVLVPRRLTRRSSVRFQEMETSKEESQAYEQPVNIASEKRSEVVNASESSSQNTKEGCQASEMPVPISEEKPGVISVSDSSSQGKDKKCEQKNTSVNPPAPHPREMADKEEKVADPSVRKGAPQAVAPVSSQSSDGKQRARGAVKMRSASQQTRLKTPVGRQGRGMAGNSLKPRARSQEIKGSPQVPPAERKITDPYTIFKNWLKRENTELQMKEKQSDGAAAEQMTEKEPSSSESVGKGDKVSAIDKGDSESTKSGEQQMESSILAEETRSPLEMAMETTPTITSIQETPTKTSSSRIFSTAGVKTRSTRNRKSAVEQPVGPVFNLSKDHEHSPISLFSSMEDIPTQNSTFTLQPPVVCDEMASQGFPVIVDNAQSSVESGQRKKNEVDDSTSNSHQEADTPLEKQRELGFSGLLKQTLDQGSGCETATEWCPREEKTLNGHIGSPEEEAFDPYLSATLRSTPLPRRSSRFQDSETSDASDSQKQAVGVDSSENMSQPSQTDLPMDTPATPDTFDPAKDSTLGEPIGHTRKRKQQTPKRIADPMALRRTPRRNSQKKSDCGCCKTKPGSKRLDCSSPPEKLCRKDRDLQSPLRGRSPRARLVREKERDAGQLSVQDLKNSVGNETRADSLNNSVENESRADSLKDSVGNESRAGSLNNSVGNESRADSLKDSVGNESRADSLNNSVGNESRADSLKDSVENESRADSLKDSVENESRADSLKDSVENESRADSLKDSVENESRADSLKDSVENESRADKDSVGNKSRAGRLKKRAPSLQDLCEVTPENKTNSTPLRQSTTQRKKNVAKQKSASKSLHPVLDMLESDSESTHFASQSPSKAPKWKKDVFNSKKEQERIVNIHTFICTESVIDSQSIATLIKSPVKALNDSTAKLGSKRSTPLKFHTGVRSPPKLRLRRKKNAPAEEVHDDGKILDIEMKQRTAVNNGDSHSPFENDVESKSGRELQLALRSKTKLKSSEEDGNKMAPQKKKGPASFTRSRRSPSSLAAQSLAKSRRTWLRKSPRQVARRKKSSPGLQTVLTKTVSEEASEEVVIEHYDSDLCSNDEAEGEPEGSQSPDGEHESKLKGSKFQDDEIENKSPEIQLPDSKSNSELHESQSQDGESEEPQEMLSLNGETVTNGTSDDVLESQGFSKNVIETPESTEMDVSGDTEEAVVFADPLNSADGHEPQQSEDILDDTLAKDTSEQSTSVCSHVKIQVGQCGGEGYTAGEGSEDIFGHDGDKDILPLPVPFSSNSNASLTENMDVDAVDSRLASEECSESDFPHNQRGLEVEQGSLTPAEVKDGIAEMIEEQEQYGNLDEVAQEDNAEITSHGNLDQGTEEGLAEITNNKEEDSHNLAAMDKDKKASPEVKTSNHTNTTKASPEEKTSKSSKQKLSKTELFMLIEQSDATAEEIIEYLQNRERNKQSSHTIPECPAENLESVSGDVPKDQEEQNQVEHLLKDCDVQSEPQSSDDRLPSILDAGCPSDIDETKCDEVDSQESTADSAADVCPYNGPASSSSRSATSPGRPEQSHISMDLQSNVDNMEDGQRLEGQCSTESGWLTHDVDSQESAASGSSLATAYVDASEAPVASASSSVFSETSASPSGLSATPEQQSPVCSSTSSYNSDSRKRRSHRSCLFEDGNTKEIECPQSFSLSANASMDSTPLPSTSATMPKRKTVQWIPDSPTTSVSPGILKRGREESCHWIPHTPSPSAPRGILKRGRDASSIPHTSTPSASPSILGRQAFFYQNATPSPSKVRRVSFPNPVEVGASPTCQRCAGVPSCADCVDPDCEEYRQNFRDCHKRMKEKQQKRKEEKMKKGEKEKKKEEKEKWGSKTTFRLKLMCMETPGSPKASTSHARQDSETPSVAQPAETSSREAGGCSLDTQGSGTPSQQDSENNSYHSTPSQGTQLHSGGPIFPELVDCTHSFDSFVSTLTCVTLGRGLQSMLLGRGVRTVGHLASLTAREVEELPFTSPKIKTLKNALRKYLEKMNSTKSNGLPTEFGTLCDGDDKQAEPGSPLK